MNQFVPISNKSHIELLQFRIMIIGLLYSHCFHNFKASFKILSMVTHLKLNLFFLYLIQKINPFIQGYRFFESKFFIHPNQIICYKCFDHTVLFPYSKHLPQIRLLFLTFNVIPSIQFLVLFLHYSINLSNFNNFYKLISFI